MTEITYTTLTLPLCRPTAHLLDICFPLMPADERYSRRDLEDMYSFFPDGTIIALDGEQVVGMGTGVFVNIDFDDLPPTESDLLEQNRAISRALRGDYYFGTDMAVHPDYRGRGIARQIYERRKAVVQKYNKKGFAAAAVLPGFEQHKVQMNIHAYIDKVLAGKLFDPTLSVQIRNGFRFVRLVHEFFTYPRSDHWGAIILWENPDYQLEEKHE